jgi:hypothetical protein
MPVVEEETPIASVLGAPRKGFARHTFVGGNFFMQRMFGRFGRELNVAGSAADYYRAADATLAALQSGTARVSIAPPEVRQGRLVANIAVENLTGHKLPTGYPSRRAWLHVTVRDRAGRIIFESGAIDPRGAITGNDNDARPDTVEPHYDVIREPGEVQIYESVMHDQNRQPTTGLLRAVGYLKDNRLLPRGFDKSTADAWIGVIGRAATDDDFGAAGDRVRYEVDVANAEGPFQIDAELRFQVIAFRWAENLRSYTSAETTRFLGYYEAMAESSSEVLATAHALSPKP